MVRKYRDITSESIDVCQKVNDDSLVLKQIAYNLAHLCDEVCESNRISRMRLKGTGISSEVKVPLDAGSSECFICGGFYDGDHVGGVIISGDGDVFCACSSCRKKFDSLLSHFVFPNEVYF